MNTNMNKVSILGCGWLGYELAKHFIANDWQVKGSTTTPEKMELLTAIGVAPFLIDIFDQKNGKVDFFQTDILIFNIPPSQGGANLSEAVKAKESLFLQAKHMIMVSSTGVYGGAEGMVDELSALSPNTARGAVLVEIEQYFARLYKSKLTILRPSGLVGGARHPGKILAGRKNISNGDAPVNLIHREDVIAAIARIINLQAWGKEYNISADDHPVKREYYTWAAERMGLAKPEFLAGGEAGKIIDNAKIKKELKLNLKYPSCYDFIQ